MGSSPFYHKCKGKREARTTRRHGGQEANLVWAEKVPGEEVKLTARSFLGMKGKREVKA